MRYIGNKKKLLTNIEEFLSDKRILNKDFIFCDAFSGTATVGMYFKDKYKKIISNDNLYFSYVMTEAILNSKDEKDMFLKLGFDPFTYFNNYDASEFKSGFIYLNYAPTKGKRQYFSDENAKLIDFIRTKIDEWFLDDLINKNERNYLIACLIESISFVSNVAGVYGACLSTWDSRALKKMKFRKIECAKYDENLADVYNEDVLSFIKKVEGDVLYLDPPYTKNQYSTQYHLLETIAKYDNPTIKGKGGLRDMSSYSSAFSRNNEAENMLEKIISKANFKYIVLSYSSDGIISKDFIDSVFKRYGKSETYEFKKILYKRYKNSKAEDNDKHQEYLFFVEKKDKKDITYSSPLNYIGGKYDMIPFLKNNMPDNIKTFYDLFGGGLNVGINVEADKIIYNDINFKVKELLEYITQTDVVDFVSYINKKIKKYKLEKNDKEAYMKLRNDYNSKKMVDRDVRDLFLLIMYGFQQQIRFNTKYDYNNPVGQACFNDNIKEKLISFSNAAKEKNISLYSEDYENFLKHINKGDFVYLDPPYLITLGSYNDGKRGFNGWNEKEEKRLLKFIDELHKKDIKFMLSNVLTHKEKTNEILKDWIEKNGFTIIEYKDKVRGNRKEIIVVNYNLDKGDILE